MIIKIKDVIDLTKLSRSTIYRLAKENRFPKPVKLSDHSSGWVMEEVIFFIEERIEQRDSQ